MSDYGSILMITKKKGNFKFFEKKNLVRRVREMVDKRDFTDALSKKFECKKFDDSKNQVSLLMSQFWYGEGDNQENFDFCKTGDAYYMTKIVDTINQKYRDHYHAEWLFENW